MTFHDWGWGGSKLVVRSAGGQFVARRWRSVAECLSPGEAEADRWAGLEHGRRQRSGEGVDYDRFAGSEAHDVAVVKVASGPGLIAEPEDRDSMA